MTPAGRELIGELRRRGATDIEELRCNKHPRISFTLDGKRLTVSYSASPSTGQSLTKKLADIQRMLRSPTRQHLAPGTPIQEGVGS